MNTATRTTTARKAMRVATVFTGAAGLAVAFGPTALAAPGHAPTQGQSARANGKTQAKGPDLHSGSIRSAGCNADTKEWLHISYSTIFRNLCKAFGFKGIMSPDSSVYMTAQCGGNNYGTIYYSDKNIPFGPGKGYREVGPGYVSAVAIYRWKGTDTCPWPR
jgi:hypothetical protein